MNILDSEKTYQLLFWKSLIFEDHLADEIKKYGTLICNRFLNHMKEIDPSKKLSDIVMFDGALNVQLTGRLLKAHYPKLTVMHGVEHTVLLFFNDVSKITIVNQMISSHKMIYNIFDSGIYHKPHYIFKYEYQELQNRNIDLFSGNETRMDGYFMGMHIDLRIWKLLQANISSAEFIIIPTNNKFDKSVRYIHDNKSWEMCYVLHRIIFYCLIVLHLAYSNTSVTEKVYYYFRMTKKCVEKKISDIDYQ